MCTCLPFGFIFLPSVHVSISSLVVSVLAHHCIYFALSSRKVCFCSSPSLHFYFHPSQSDLDAAKASLYATARSQRYIFFLQFIDCPCPLHYICLFLLLLHSLFSVGLLHLYVFPDAHWALWHPWRTLLLCLSIEMTSEAWVLYGTQTVVSGFKGHLVHETWEAMTKNIDMWETAGWEQMAI